MEAIHCNAVSMNFIVGDIVTMALRGVDLSCHMGELLMLVGPSGCGKTTLLSIIAGILSPTSGRISLFETDIMSLEDEAKVIYRRHNIGFIFQQYNLLPALTAAQNAAVPLIAQGMNFDQATAQAKILLSQIGMGDHVHKFPRQLSGGQQQRVAIARALIHKPRLIVCDEPTAALDAETGQTVMELLRASAVQKDRAVLVVTHDNRIFHFADRIAHMENGRITNIENNGSHHA